jgi:capsid protein
LPFSKQKKFENHNFRPRRWPWVDPEKDVNAAKIAIDNRLKSRTEVIAENSQTSFAAVIAEQSLEQEIADEAGVSLPDAAAEAAAKVAQGKEIDGEAGKSKAKEAGAKKE